ncbi:MAG TPA: hypothetical protein VFE63_14075 [Roseiarcus sp.]|nr:hypothetical protein [Roseiarcus sp.]
MTSYIWQIASNGDWSAAGAWSPSGAPPTSTDSATIAATGSAYTVSVSSADVAGALTLSSANATLNDDGASASLTIGGTLTVSNGTLNVANGTGGSLTVGALNLSGGSLSINTNGRLNLSGGILSQTGGTLTLAGGTIAGGTINSTAGTLALNSGKLSGVTFDGPLNLTSATVQQTVDLANGTTIVGSSGSGPGTINVTGYSSVLNFDNTQTVGNVTINLGASRSSDYLNDNDTAAAGNKVLTLASSVVVNATGFSHFSDGGQSGDGIVNRGVINQTGDGTMYVAGNAFTNSGTINAKGAGALDISAATFSNSGTIDVANGDNVTIEPTTFTTTASSLITIEANSSLTIDPANAWSNLGSITLASGASLTLLGSMSAASLGSITNSNGTVNIAGTYNNSGQTLDGSASFGQLVLLNGGAITGGTATSAGVGFANNGGTLSGVTFDGPLNLTSTSMSQTVDLANGATVVGSSGSGPGTINVTGFGSQLKFDNTQTVSNETINLGSSSFLDHLYENDTAGAGAQVLTLAPSVTINVTGRAQIQTTSSSGDAIVNQGVISQTGSSSLTISGNTFTNSGTIDANGNTLTISATTFTNSGTIDVANGETATIGPTVFTNLDNGVIQLGGGTLRSSGSSSSLTDAAGSTLIGFGTVTVTTFANSGTIEASGGTLTLTDAVTGTGGLRIDGGADLVAGGAIASGATATFNGANAALTLNSPSSFGATIGGFALEDTIDLVGITANGASVNGSSQLVVSENGTAVATLQLDGAYSDFAFVTQAVAGGTNVIALPVPATVAQYLGAASLYDEISGGFAISDTAASISAALDQLDDANITSITISDNGAIGVDVAQLTSDATAISKLQNANATPCQLAMTDTAADITAGLDGLDGSNIASITISDNGAIGVSVAQLTSDATAISKLQNADATPYQLAVTDTAADITAGLDGLDGSNIGSITISDNGAIGVDVAQLTSDATAISKLQNANATPFQLAVADSLPNIVGDLSGLNGNSHIVSLDATSGAATLSGGAVIDAPAFSLTGSSTVLTLAEILSYSGSFSEGAGSTVKISSGDALTMSGTTSLSGRVGGAGALALAGGSTTFDSDASLPVSHWTISGSGTSVTLAENLTYAGAFSAGVGTTLNLTGGGLTLAGTDSFAGATTSGSKTLTAKGTTTLLGLTIGGKTTFSDGGALAQSGGSVTVGDAAGDVAKLTITATGTWDITDDSGIARGTSTSSAITNNGLLEKTSGTGASVITPKVTNTGVNTGGGAVDGGIYVSSGTLDFKGAVIGGAVATPGPDTISTISGASSSVLEFDAAVASSATVGSQDIVFGSGGGTLDLTKPTNFWGEISGFAAGDAVDLLGNWKFSSISDVSGVTTLTLANGATTKHAFTFVGDYAQGDFHIASGSTTIITHT